MTKKNETSSGSVPFMGSLRDRANMTWLSSPKNHSMLREKTRTTMNYDYVCAAAD